jgi:hypothetical protein
MFSVYDQLALRVAHFTSWRAYNAKGANWRTIQIQECGERLVQVPEEFAYPTTRKTCISPRTRGYSCEKVFLNVFGSRGLFYNRKDMTFVSTTDGDRSSFKSDSSGITFESSPWRSLVSRRRLYTSTSTEYERLTTRFRKPCEKHSSTQTGRM